MAQSLGWIGYGSFGKFFLPYLMPHFNISVYDIKEIGAELEGTNLFNASLEEISQTDIIILSVPVQFLDSILIQIAPLIKHKCLVMDVSSVKMKPISLMQKYLPEHCEIVGTHPLFGPQSGKNGIKSLNIVVCNVKTTQEEKINYFLGKILGLHILARTPEAHDKEMAYVQGLTHFIGRAINQMDIPDVEQKTPAYDYLLSIKKNLGKDSLDLFYTIEKENPFASEVTDHFMVELEKLKEFLNR